MTATIAKKKTGAQAPATPPHPRDHNRLPCRGCTSGCSNYPHCNARPWRL